MQMTPLIAVHATAAALCVGVGPFALWARLRSKQLAVPHRAFGYAFVTLMIVAAVSAIFIRDDGYPATLGYTPIHLLIPFTLVNFFFAFRALAQGRIGVHRRIMIFVYIGACLIAGAFTLLPSRYLGHVLWRDWLALL